MITISENDWTTTTTTTIYYPFRNYSKLKDDMTSLWVSSFLK